MKRIVLLLLSINLFTTPLIAKEGELLQRAEQVAEASYFHCITNGEAPTADNPVMSSSESERFCRCIADVYLDIVTQSNLTQKEVDLMVSTFTYEHSPGEYNEEEQIISQTIGQKINAEQYEDKFLICTEHL